MPLPLKLLTGAALISAMFLMVLLPWGWRLWAGMVAWLLVFGSISSRLNEKYEKTGEAVRLKLVGVVSFPNGAPAGISFLRVAFFVIVAVMLFFAAAHLSLAVAHAGIAASMVGLMVLGVVYVFAERHYVKTGRGIEKFRK